MKKIFLSFVFGCFLSALCFSQNPAPTVTPKPAEEDDDIVKISTALIQVDVTVTDKNGKIVTDLKPEDFEIYENKEKQQITNFSFVLADPQESVAQPQKTEKNKEPNIPLPPVPVKPEQIRRTIALVVDDLGLSYESTYFVRRSLKKFVDEQMQPNDLVAVVRTGRGAGALQQFTSDKRQLYAAIEALKWNPLGRAGVSALSPIEPTPLESAGASQEDIDEERRRISDFNNFRDDIFSVGTLGAINVIVKGMDELPGRKSIMLFSDGFVICNPEDPDRCVRLKDSLKQLTDLCNRAAVSIYSLDARGLVTTGITAADRIEDSSPQNIQRILQSRTNEVIDKQEGLAYLANETGGRSFFNNNDFNKSLERALEDQKGFYLIGYQPDTETFDPKTRRFNELDIKVKRPGLSVRYRSGFFGVADRKVEPAQKTPAQQILAALTSPFAASGIELHLNTLFGKTDKDEAFVQSFLHVDAKELKFSDNPDGWKQSVFDVLAVNYGANGVPVEQISKTYTLKVKGETYERIAKEGFVYNFMFPIKKAGAYQMRVAIRDTATSKIGSASQFIEVPDVKKQRLTLSGIILENLTAQEWQKYEAGNFKEVRTDPQTDTSLRRFKKGTILRYGVDIYNAKTDAAQKPNIQTQIRVFRDGKIILDGKPKPLNAGQQTNPSRLNFIGALNLGAEMLPGDYVLQIIVTDNLAKEKRKLGTQWVQFEVTE